MNCQELTDSISNIKAQLIKLDIAVGDRKPDKAINIKKEIEELFNNELLEYTALFYRDPTPENYDKEVNRIINKIGDRDPLEVTFSRKELIFIYDTDDKAKFNDFGHESMENVYIIRWKRRSKRKEDASIIFNLPPDQIIWSDDIITPNTPKEDIDSILKESITPNTKLYVGLLFPGIFDFLNLEHIYTSFPEGRIRKSSLEIGGKTEQQLEVELEKNGHKISGDARSMLDRIYQSEEFKKHQGNPEQINTIRLKVKDLGFPNGATIQEIYDKAKEYGLTLCPTEVGPYQRLMDTEQPMINWYKITMDPIADSFSIPDIFYWERTSEGLCLHNDWEDQGRWWDPDDEVVFRSDPSTRA